MERESVITQLVQLKDKDGIKQYPVTLSKAVICPNGESLEDRLAELERKFGELERSTIMPLYE